VRAVRYEFDDSAAAIGVFLLTMFMVILFWIATPAHSQEAPQNPCGPSAAITAMLLDKYGETPAVAGLADGTPILIFTNPKTSSFTITVRRPGGLACLITAGNSWTALEQPKAGIDL
jgi:hypothetical protein